MGKIKSFKEYGLFEAEDYSSRIKKWASNNKNKPENDLNRMYTAAQAKIRLAQRKQDQCKDDSNCRDRIQNLEIMPNKLIIDGIAYLRAQKISTPQK
jgi:hypothetical protein